MTGSDSGRDPDTKLTDTGHKQAELLAQHLPGVLPWKVEAIYTSLMTRAVQTAAPLAAALDLPLIGRSDMYEVGGPLEIDQLTREKSPHPGASDEALRAISDRLVLPQGADHDGWWSGPVENETDEPTRRAHTLIADLRALHEANATVALVSHGLFSQFLFREFLGIQVMSGWVTIYNTSVTLYEDVPEFGNSRALRTNWTPHLPESLITD